MPLESANAWMRVKEKNNVLVIDSRVTFHYTTRIMGQIAREVEPGGNVRENLKKDVIGEGGNAIKVVENPLEDVLSGPSLQAIDSGELFAIQSKQHARRPRTEGTTSRHTQTTYALEDSNTHSYQVHLEAVAEPSEQDLKDEDALAHENIILPTDSPILSPIFMLIKHAREIPYLSSEQEIALAIRIRKAKEVGSSPQTPEDIQTCLSGEEARRTLADANLGLVISIASKYAGNAFPLEDIVGYGNIGLMHAIDKFDHRKGFRFSTYATWWIKKAISGAIIDYSTRIRYPSHFSGFASNVHRTIRDLTSSETPNPTALQVAESMGSSEEAVQDVLDVDYTFISADTQQKSNDQAGDLLTIGERLSRGVSAEDEAETPVLRAELVSHMSTILSPLEMACLILRYGIGTNSPKNLEEIAQVVGAGRETVRKTILIGEEHLRVSPQFSHFKEYLG